MIPKSKKVVLNDSQMRELKTLVRPDEFPDKDDSDYEDQLDELVDSLADELGLELDD